MIPFDLVFEIEIFGKKHSLPNPTGDVFRGTERDQWHEMG